MGNLDELSSQLVPQSDSTQPLSRAVDMMREYFQRKSLTSYYSLEAAQYCWYSSAPQISRYDSKMLDTLLNNAKRYLAGAFPILEPFEASFDTPEELVLAMAAVGALFCSVSGGERVAKALWNDARRIAFVKVGPVNTLMT